MYRYIYQLFGIFERGELVVKSEKNGIVKKKWLEVGYRDFALDGPDKLSVNQMAKKIGASRSSFYHHFAEVDLFVDELLSYHWNMCQKYNEVGRNSCKSLIPDLYKILAQYPIPLQFSRQLFLNRHIPRYDYVFRKSYETSAHIFVLELFADQLGLQLPESDLNYLFLTLGEAWYSRLNPQDLSADTLQGHAEDILQNLMTLIDSGVYTKLRKTS